VPNEVIQYVATTVGVVNVANATPVPLIVPGGRAFRVRYVEFRDSPAGGGC